MESQVDRIREKLDKLRGIDTAFNLFGANAHKYILNPMLQVQQIKEFEIIHGIDLPLEHVSFLTQVDNGGTGSLYGISNLEKSIYVYPTEMAVSALHFVLVKPFPHPDKWNVEKELDEITRKIDEANENRNEELEYALYKQKDELIGGDEHDFGRLYITDYSCGIVLSLIVNGAEKDHMWTGDRVNDNGLFPSTELENSDRITFLNWYELWLDKPLNEVKQLYAN